MNQDDELFRHCVGIIILNKKQQVWLGKRIMGTWQFPQGGVEETDAEIYTAKRELREETGIISAHFIKSSATAYKYLFPSSNHPYWTFIGQRIRYFLFNFEGDDSEINLNTHHPEFETWKWSDPQQAVQEIVEFKRNIAQNVLVEFGLIDK